MYYVYHFPPFSRQGTTSAGSGGVAQRARHPDELKKEDGKWMNNCHQLLCVALGLAFFILPIQFVTNITINYVHSSR